MSGTMNNFLWVASRFTWRKTVTSSKACTSSIDYYNYIYSIRLHNIFRSWPTLIYICRTPSVPLTVRQVILTDESILFRLVHRPARLISKIDNLRKISRWGLEINHGFILWAHATLYCFLCQAVTVAHQFVYRPKTRMSYLMLEKGAKGNTVRFCSNAFNFC